MDPLKARLLTLAGTVAVLVTVAACSHSSFPGGTVTTSDRAKAVSQLASRPDIDTAMAGYDRLLKTVRERLTSAGITGKWSTFLDPGDAACGEFGDANTDLNAETRSTASWGTETGIADAQWTQALSTVTQAAKPAGFSKIEVVKDEPGHHVVALGGPYGAVLSFSTQVKTSIAIDSGCHRVPGKPIDPNDPSSTAS